MSERASHGEQYAETIAREAKRRARSRDLKPVLALVPFLKRYPGILTAAIVALAEPRHEEITHRRGQREHRAHAQQREKIAVDEFGALFREAVIHHLAHRRGQHERRRRRDGERDDRRRENAGIALEEGNERQHGLEIARARPPLGLALDGPDMLFAAALLLAHG